MLLRECSETDRKRALLVPPPKALGIEPNRLHEPLPAEFLNLHATCKSQLAEQALHFVAGCTKSNVWQLLCSGKRAAAAAAANMS
jgi:hypothetical protein